MMVPVSRMKSACYSPSHSLVMLRVICKSEYYIVHEDCYSPVKYNVVTPYFSINYVTCTL